MFPAWRPRLGSRTAQTLHRVRSYTLCPWENCLAGWLPADLFPKAPAKENSRDRDDTRGRTFWCMIWQALNPEASCREVVRQLQALFSLEGGPRLSEEDGAYGRRSVRASRVEMKRYHD